MSVSRLLPITNNTDVVTFTIKVNGTAVPKAYNILSITVNKEINRIPTARIIISDGDSAVGDFTVSDEDTLIPGNDIEIYSGYYSADDIIFKGIITQHALKIRNTYSQLIIECKDAAVKTTVGEKNKFFSDKKDSEVIQEILGDYPDLQNDIADTSFQNKQLVQFNATDWDFIVSRVEANGQVCIVDDGTITTQVPDISGDALASPLFGSNIIELDAEIDARVQTQSVKTSTWDFSGQQISEATASDPGWEENGNLDTTQLADVIGLEAYQYHHGGSLETDELQSWADALLLRQKMAKTRGRVKFQGMATVKPGTILELAGVGDRMNGKVYVTGVRHELINGNWICDAQFGLDPEWHIKQFKINAQPVSDLLPAVKGLHVGVVTHLQDDPIGENRIQVKIPTISPDDDGIWARVATLDAGDQRGTFFLPEISDEVIVGFVNDDPRFAVVLGMLHSSGKPAPLDASDDNNQKGIFTREKIKILFDDDKKSVTIQTPAEQKVVLDDNAGSISLEDKNGNKITMDSSGITIDSAGELSIKSKKDIKVEGSMNVNLKATAQFKAEGTAGIEVSSSANAVLKGAIVQIN
jgi:Rhs element Vgr protein